MRGGGTPSRGPPTSGGPLGVVGGDGCAAAPAQAHMAVSRADLVRHPATLCTPPVRCGLGSPVGKGVSRGWLLMRAAYQDWGLFLPVNWGIQPASRARREVDWRLRGNPARISWRPPAYPRATVSVASASQHVCAVPSARCSPARLSVRDLPSPHVQSSLVAPPAGISVGERARRGQKGTPVSAPQCGSAAKMTP